MDPIQQEIVELKMRVERLEQILSDLGHNILPPGSSPETTKAVPGFESEVRALVAAGNMLEAIKVYRQHTGCSLYEAKTRVEAMRG